MTDNPAPKPLTWALCVATLNRPDILVKSVALALEQIPAPSEVVIVDASDDWQSNKARVEALFPAPNAPPLKYHHSAIRALPVQRNIGINDTSADVLFLFDDDTLMHQGSAQAILDVYEADTDGRIAGVSAVNAGPLPGMAPGSDAPGRRAPGKTSSGLARFIWKEVFLMNSERRFIQYDCRPAPAPDTAAYLARFEGVRQLKMMSGYLMTVRANVAIAEPFDETLLAYAPAEDLDATYRFSRHGLLVSAPGGRIYHAEAPAGRLKRVTAKALAITNIAYFIRQKSTTQFRHIFAFYILSFRTIVAETLKDILSRRFEFPHLRGTFQGIVQSVGIFRTPRDELPATYDALQRKLLGIRK